MESHRNSQIKSNFSNRDDAVEYSCEKAPRLPNAL